MQYPISFSVGFKKNKLPGMLIAIEGIDGSGKTTQALELVKALKKKKYKAIYTKEPTDEPTGLLIRQVLSGKVKVPPLSLQYLFCADRGVHQLELEKYLKKGYIVITDRYFWSAIAYVSSDQAGDTDYYMAAFSVLSMYKQFMAPNFTFFLDLPFKDAFARISKSSKHNEIYDKKEKLLKIEKAYKVLTRKFPSEFTVVDANRPVVDLQKDLLARIEKIAQKKYGKS